MSHHEWWCSCLPLPLPSVLGDYSEPPQASLPADCPLPAANHSFKKIEFQPPEAKKFFSTVRKEMALLATSLPDGIMVKTFEDRMASGLLGTRGGAWVQMPWGMGVAVLPCCGSRHGGSGN